MKSGAKPLTGASLASFKVKDSFANTKKTSFQRKAV
jgi:glutamate synthase domain-containing protein 2